ncbi:hypothetical protein Drorol1_Dr00013763, partial [Drosera rotundifolia]
DPSQKGVPCSVSPIFVKHQIELQRGTCLLMVNGTLCSRRVEGLKLMGRTLYPLHGLCTFKLSVKTQVAEQHSSPAPRVMKVRLKESDSLSCGTEELFSILMTKF